MRHNREINTLIIHCSATEFGNKSLFKRWHHARGWDDVGYHYIILNSYPLKKQWYEKTPNFTSDGKIEKGRPEENIGAHTRLHNDNSIGICLVGERTFTSKQFLSLKRLVEKLQKKYNLKTIKGHYEYDTAQEQGKTCPNIDMDWLRGLLV
ncbi:MAG: N-acetylmuramoyl-L-alanine amidase [Candidatus Delongbacteria bacterium]|jgi:N-acetylmuramoyl-L-alanine amidase|nr:N-acetylmuramoyl-L-alanine amidase [Candidatus Delongbacteria bacterium]